MNPTRHQAMLCMCIFRNCLDMVYAKIINWSSDKTSAITRLISINHKIRAYSSNECIDANLLQDCVALSNGLAPETILGSVPVVTVTNYRISYKLQYNNLTNMNELITCINSKMKISKNVVILSNTYHSIRYISTSSVFTVILFSSKFSTT